MNTEEEVESLRDRLASAQRENDELKALRESSLAEHEEQLRTLKKLASICKNYFSNDI